MLKTSVRHAIIITTFVLPLRPKYLVICCLIKVHQLKIANVFKINFLFRSSFSCHLLHLEELILGDRLMVQQCGRSAWNFIRFTRISYLWKLEWCAPCNGDATSFYLDKVAPFRSKLEWSLGYGQQSLKNPIFLMATWVMVVDVLFAGLALFTESLMEDDRNLWKDTGNGRPKEFRFDGFFP